MSKATETLVNSAPNILDQFLNKSLEYLSSAEAFIKAEVPSFIQEFMAWKFYEALIQFGFNLALVIGLLLSAKFLIKKAKNYVPSHHSDDWYIPLYAFGVASLIGGIIMSFTLMNPIQKIIKIKVAPRVFLLEEVRQLIK